MSDEKTTEGEPEVEPVKPADDEQPVTPTSPLALDPSEE
jgi:hypothetical protein